MVRYVGLDTASVITCRAMCAEQYIYIYVAPLFASLLIGTIVR
jgi:hypothetical protein